jgi:TPR repeat protein
MADLHSKTMTKPHVARAVPALLALALSISHAAENKSMDKDTPASPSSGAPISGAQSFALTDEQRAALAAKAEAGDAEAAFRLAQHYGFLRQDYAQQRHWLSIAAKGGHAVAQHNLAYLLYMKDKDLAGAAHWASESQKNGNSNAGELLKEIESARPGAGGKPRP